ncbi:MAG: GNAT family N-acetyltransferase [Candidatus Magasanikbacteria bacterium]|nr:GNAT family N-acetyltransferase [Candidatus Magasanikbacteria bacterium]
MPESTERPDSEKSDAAPEVVSRAVLVEKASKLRETQNPAVAILLSGDRISCCDEGVIMEKAGNLIGMATIAPEGEEGSGQPTIVALYIEPKYRSQGNGAQILRKAVERCVERGFDKIRMDVMSANAMKIIEKLPAEMQKKIDVYDLGNIMDNF